MIMLIGSAVIMWASVVVAGEIKKGEQSKRDDERYQSTIDRATELLGDGGAPNRKRR